MSDDIYFIIIIAHVKWPIGNDSIAFLENLTC